MKKVNPRIFISGILPNVRICILLFTCLSGFTWVMHVVSCSVVRLTWVGVGGEKSSAIPNRLMTGG